MSLDFVVQVFPFRIKCEGPAFGRATVSISDVLYDDFFCFSIFLF
jgi:hypothetical protein